jgi:hypothetical protein
LECAPRRSRIARLRRRRRWGARRGGQPRQGGAGRATRLGESPPRGGSKPPRETHIWQPPTVTWSYAVHIAIVEVDRETGRVGIDKYAVAHDCDVVVNPMLVGSVVDLNKWRALICVVNFENTHFRLTLIGPHVPGTKKLCIRVKYIPSCYDASAQNALVN